MKARLFWIAMAALAALSAIGLASYLGGELPTPALVPGDERTVILELQWGGDVYTSEEATCDVWTAQFNCELRRGGNLGTIISQTLPLASPIAMADPPSAGVVVTTTLTWDTSDLTVGPYETFCRLEETNGTDTIWGYIEGEGQDGQGFYLADKFAIGQTCIIPRRFIATLQ
jgi:hypothetical protein